MATKKVNGEEVTLSVSEEAAMNAEWDANLIIETEVRRVAEIKIAGLALINAIFPAIKDLDEIKFQAEFWLSIAPASRQATADFQSVIDIYAIAKQAIISKTLIDDVVWL